ncbi:MAG: NAD(P)H-hydrate dehydratase [Desulfobacteraceae bacterium]|nr:MAG: NAD(P)H-hydrate dehydratase [Desulfobacteraceae bacterium]
MYLVTAEEMREMDRKTIVSFGLSGRLLMEAAGRGAFECLLKEFPYLLKGGAACRVGVAAGRGNNGGDGFVIARHLARTGVRVTVYLLAARSEAAGDAAENLHLLEPLKIPVVEIKHAEEFDAAKSDMQQNDLWIDAILGIGLKSDVKGYFKEVIRFLNSLEKPVFAVDIPSGLNSDTGQPCGICIRAKATATFAFPKIGHFLYPGAEYTGKLHIVDIGIPSHIVEEIGPAQRILTPPDIQAELIRRDPDAHKGRTGHLLVLSGSVGKTGAAAMTALSAIRSGAGLVTLGIAESLNPIAETLVLEAMTVPLPEYGQGYIGESAFEPVMELLKGKQCLAIGPGIGTAPETARLMHRLIRKCPVPMIIDADGLNNLAGHTKILKETRIPMILTPHPGEMARLTGTPAGEIQKDRIRTAREFAVSHGVHVVLKGARTVIAHPDGTACVNPTGNPGMASGGMGDVLTGIIAGLVAQGYSIESAARVGVYLHGAAADTLSRSIGPFGFLASEVMNAVPGEVKRLMES